MITEQKTLAELKLGECFFFFGDLWIVKSQSARSTIGRAIEGGRKRIELNNTTLVEQV